MGTDVVGLGDLLEEGVGLRRGVLVGVVLHGEAAVAQPAVVVGGAAADRDPGAAVGALELDRDGAARLAERGVQDVGRDHASSPISFARRSRVILICSSAAVRSASSESTPSSSNRRRAPTST